MTFASQSWRRDRHRLMLPLQMRSLPWAEEVGVTFRSVHSSPWLVTWRGWAILLSQRLLARGFSRQVFKTWQLSSGSSCSRSDPSCTFRSTRPQKPACWIHASIFSLLLRFIFGWRFSQANPTARSAQEAPNLLHTFAPRFLLESTVSSPLLSKSGIFRSVLRPSLQTLHPIPTL